MARIRPSLALALFAAASAAFAQQADTSPGAAWEAAGGPTGSLGPPADGGPPAWGIAGLRGFAFSQQVAPNGLEFKPLFAMDLNFNLWLCRGQGVYLFSDSTFWGQRAAPGITNAAQGPLDFSKREFDFSVGTAWNVGGPLELRASAYSLNNLNRGNSSSRPSGYADGILLEGRYYLGDEYASLGAVGYDLARSPFLSAGYYPTKDLISPEGQTFKPGPFLRAYLTLDVLSPRCYLFADARAVAGRDFTPRILQGNLGVAVRPFADVPRFEFRLGSDSTYGPRGGETEVGVYGQIRYLF